MKKFLTNTKNIKNKDTNKHNSIKIYSFSIIGGVIFGLVAASYTAQGYFKHFQKPQDPNNVAVSSELKDDEEENKIKNNQEVPQEKKTQIKKVEQKNTVKPTGTKVQVADVPQATVMAKPASNQKPVTISKASTYSGIYSTSSAQNYVEDEILRLVNQERARLRIRPLSYDTKLRQAADIRAREEAITSFIGVNHTRPNGQNWSTVLKQVGYTGYRAAGENLVWGYKSTFAYSQKDLKALALKMFTSWKNSSGHYAQIKNANYNQTGIGVVLTKKNSRIYYFGIQLFAKR